jgi:hypothetical protein
MVSQVISSAPTTTKLENTNRNFSFSEAREVISEAGIVRSTKKNY